MEDGFTLVVAEKPSQASLIAKALDLKAVPREDHSWFLPSLCVLIVPAEGHLFRLPTPDELSPDWKTWTWDTLPIIPSTFVPVPSSAKSLATLLRVLDPHRSDLGPPSRVVNACDAGREGELIFFQIASHFGWPHSQIQRLWLSSLDPNAIRLAWHSLRPFADSQPLIDAAVLRQRIDWIIGMNLSRSTTLLFRSTGESAQQSFSVGRVQTPTLRAIVDNTREVNGFRKVTFYSGLIDFISETGQSFQATLLAPDSFQFGRDSRWANFDALRNHLNEVILRSGDAWTLLEDLSEVLEYPPPFFTTTDLFRSLFRRFGWSAQRSEKAAQEAYLKGLISYPRTDSSAVPLEVAEWLMAHCKDAWLSLPWFDEPDPVPDDFLSRYTPPCPFPADHHAIVPTRFSDLPPHRSTDADLVFDLVRKRTLVAMGPPATILACSRLLALDAVGVDLRALCKDSSLQSPGWLTAEYVAGGTGDERVPLFSRKRDPIKPSGNYAYAVRQEIKPGETVSPALYNDDTLLGFMARSGLGTSATRVSIIESLVTSRFVDRLDGGFFSASELGCRLVDALASCRADFLLSPAYTAELEKALDAIAGTPSLKRRTRLIDEQWNAAITQILWVLEAMLASSRNGSLDSLPVLCPRSFVPVETTDDGFFFPGFPRVRFPKTIANRPMSAFEYREILLAGRAGGSVLHGFTKKTGEVFSSRLRFQPRLKRFAFA
jgi:DNA topoisomerase-3